MLLLTPSVSGLFKWRQFEPEVILLAVGWYLRFSLSYRDVEELLAERGLLVDHVTVWRWVQHYALQIQRRLRPRLRPTTESVKKSGVRHLMTIGRTARRTTRGINRLKGSVGDLPQPAILRPRLFGALPLGARGPGGLVPATGENDGNS